MSAFKPCDKIEGALHSPLIFLCDHAYNHFPETYGTLGLDDAQLERHIAYDPGALGVSKMMRDVFNAHLVYTYFSRLLIDPNRGEKDPTLIMRMSDRAVIEGNRYVDDKERAHRLEAYYRPYDRLISQKIDVVEAQGLAPILISIHSFTPIWRGKERPWHIGLLWDEDARLAVPYLDDLRQEHSDLCIGDNEPYTGQMVGDTLHRHGTQKGHAHVLIEVRQDLIETESGQKKWGALLAQSLERILLKNIT